MGAMSSASDVRTMNGPAGPMAKPVTTTETLACKCGAVLGPHAAVTAFLQKPKQPGHQPNRCHCGKCDNVIEWRVGPNGGALYWLNRHERRQLKHANLVHRPMIEIAGESQT